MDERWIYFVEINDYESSWYTSIWDDKETAQKAYNEYELIKNNHEIAKRWGKRLLNTTEFIGEYFE